MATRNMYELIILYQVPGSGVGVRESGRRGTKGYSGPSMASTMCSDALGRKTYSFTSRSLHSPSDAEAEKANPKALLSDSL